MKRNSYLIILMAGLSLVTGYLLSAVSSVGRAGINLMYTEYGFLKTWWKDALLVFVVWMVLLSVQGKVLPNIKKSSYNFIQTLAILIAIAGLYFSYYDFQNTLSHRWLGEKFHVGVYLFWGGWLLISAFLLSEKKQLAEDYINIESFN